MIEQIPSVRKRQKETYRENQRKRSFVVKIDEKNKNEYELKITSKNKNEINNSQTRTKNTDFIKQNVKKEKNKINKNIVYMKHRKRLKKLLNISIIKINAKGRIHPTKQILKLDVIKYYNITICCQLNTF